ncbi:hypothetical protein CNMCM5878_002269 [Aspergillus fumigatiaffinis]|nr:hypothetical protein CNMCM5878_002269 [Aspergillus fumigatiaffinis]
MTLCLPSVCDIHLVTANDTCSSIMGNLTRQISLTTFRSWNPRINSLCSNLQTLEGQYICASPPGSMTIASGFPLATATTAAPVPTDYVTTSNTDCGTWYKITDGDTCDSVIADFSISMDDLMFLNPQLDANCTSLWLGNSYCVQAVGNIKTYSGYGTTTTSYPALSSTINLNATKTANRTTTHFFGSVPEAQTTTVSFNTTAYNMTQNYTLCADALSYYNLTSDDFGSTEYDNSDWWSEYMRVCWLNLTLPLPTVPFNTSIILSTEASTAASSTAVAGATSTIPSASATSTVTSNVSPDGLCGASHGYTCEGSQFGDCCSTYGYCGSGDDYCGSACDPTYGLCNPSSGTTMATATVTTTSTSASSTSASNISPNGLCGELKGYTCAGSQFGACCSIYGYW